MYFLFYPRGMGNPFYISFFQIDAGWHFARNKRLYHCDRHLALSLIDERSSYQFTEFYRGVCYLGDKHGEDLCTWIHNAQHNCHTALKTQQNILYKDQFVHNQTRIQETNFYRFCCWYLSFYIHKPTSEVRQILYMNLNLNEIIENNSLKFLLR